MGLASVLAVPSSQGGVGVGRGRKRLGSNGGQRQLPSHMSPWQKWQPLTWDGPCIPTPNQAGAPKMLADSIMDWVATDTVNSKGRGRSGLQLRLGFPCLVTPKKFPIHNPFVNRAPTLFWLL